MSSQSHAVFAVTAIVLIIVLLVQWDSSWGDMCYVTSSVDGKSYKVRNLPDKQHAANLLANTHQKLQNACQILDSRHGNDERVRRLNERFRNTSLSEADGSGKHTSYSINKGEQIVLCLRSKKGLPGLVDPNLLLFVALHEISHIMTKSIGHTKEFWANFKFVLENCQHAGLYRCINFSSNPKEYCGITVTNSPVPCSG